MKALINRSKNFLYTHEERTQMFSVSIHTAPMFWRGKLPLITKENLKGVLVGIYRPTKKIYSDPKQFPGKEMPQREYGLVRTSYKAA